MDLEIVRRTSIRKRSEGKEGTVVDMPASCIWSYKAAGRHMHKPPNIVDMPEGSIFEKANEYTMGARRTRKERKEGE